MTPTRTRRQVPLAWAALVAALGLVLGAGASYGLLRPSTPSEGSVEAGFVRDMQAHHAQAVEMSWLVAPQTDDPELGALAYDIALTQENQRGQMRGWLQQWGLPLVGEEPVMAWMGGDESPDHDTTELGTDHAGLMPGMATSAEMDQLREAEGEPAEVRYLELMTTHHEAGVEMARYAAEHASDPDVVVLAETMVAGQQSEIDLMASMLAERST